jgi:hypothetical protein
MSDEQKPAGRKLGVAIEIAEDPDPLWPAWEFGFLRRIYGDRPLFFVGADRAVVLAVSPDEYPLESTTPQSSFVRRENLKLLAPVRVVIEITHERDVAAAWHRPSR